MNLFWKRLFGVIASTEKYEQQQTICRENLKRYLQIEKSEKFEEYKRLYDVVHSSEFLEKKQMLQKRKYKDSEEYKTIKKKEKLDKNKELQLYFKTLSSTELKEYLDYKSSPEYEEILTNKKSEAAQRLRKFEKSKNFQTYIRYNNSYILKEYDELNEKINSLEFRQANDFWKDKSRWTRSDEYVLEQRYLAFSNDVDILFYQSQNTDDIQRLLAEKLSFEDNFDGTQINSGLWSSGYYYEAPLIGNFSYANEQQANNSGKNIRLADGSLRLAVKKEKITSRTWDAAKGFVEKTFDYSADVLQTGGKFSQKEGSFQVKMRCSGKAHQAFWLGAKSRLPYVQLAHVYDKQVTMGIFMPNGVKETIVLKGLDPSNFYIYSLVWGKNEMIWKVNNYEVFRTALLPVDELFLGLNAFIKENENPQEALFEIDWVKVYSGAE